ncbi:superoxide dismutase family protein [Streptomyces sp. NPDC090106]|uniref:superoxide dismutase family protein n=1 Tax=Streptomyces sp. NPDC090106 TaxID=3365946 RepID=UPI003817FCBE
MVAGILAGAVAAAMLTSGVHGYEMRTDAQFAPPTAFVPSAAVTYDMALVPAASWIEVGQRSEELGPTTVRLRVTGFAPGHRYGVHVHRSPCGADPAAAGGHYQHEPSPDAQHAGAGNEVWLDFTADADGSGAAEARHAWGFRRGEASSVVIHSAPGAKGDRVGCFTVPFGGSAV